MTCCLLPIFPHPPTQRLTQNTSENKKKRPSSADGNSTQDSHRDIVSLSSSYRLQSSSHPAGLPQSSALFLQNCRTAEEESQKHISVIQATGLAASNSPLAQSHREASPLPFSNSPKHLSRSSSPKHNPVSSSPKPLSLCCPSKPLSLCSSPKPLHLSSLPKAPTLLASKKPRHKPKFLMPSPKRTLLLDGMKESSGLLHLNSFKLNKVSYICYYHYCIEAEFRLRVKKTLTVMKHKRISYPPLSD